MTAATALAAVPPARGAPLSDIVPASLVALVAVAALGAVAISHRRGSFPLLARWGGISERVGLPGWAGVPIAVATVSLLVAAFGFYWDVSWHIDRGRDPGPFANPAHWFIIVGLAGIALAGILAVVMGDDRDSGASIRLADGWRVPVGAVLLTVCGCLALAGFPLDDAWHRIFGQDVTLWGPTHIQMIGGASLATLAMWILIVEGLRVRRRERRDDSARNWVVDHQDIFIGGAFLIGMSTLQAEFDFGVPQFRQLYHPVLLMLGASVALVAVRIRAGRGSALGAALFFLAIRGLLTVLIGPVLGRTILHFPLYLVEALIVEVVAARVGEGRQLTLGLWAGAGIGTVGLAAEWAWSHIWMPLPWHASLLPEAAVFGFLAAVAGGTLGGLAGRALAPPEAPRQATRRGLAAAAWVGALLCIAYPLPMTAPNHVSAHVRTTDAAVGPERQVNVDILMRPADAADHTNWFDVTAWQGRRTGDGGLVIASLHKVGPGHYVTTKPVPADGEWKTIARLHRGRELLSMPIYMPQDNAIPAPLIAAWPQFDRQFVRDKSLLQREAIGGTPRLQRAAYAGVGIIALAWIASLAWGLRRLDRSATGRPVRPAATPEGERQRAA